MPVVIMMSMVTMVVMITVLVVSPSGSDCFDDDVGGNGDNDIDSCGGSNAGGDDNISGDSGGSSG